MIYAIKNFNQIKKYNKYKIKQYFSLIYRRLTKMLY